MSNYYLAVVTRTALTTEVAGKTNATFQT